MADAALVLFEDDRAGLFEPVALTRSVARLRVGLWTHQERWSRLFPERGAGVVVRGALVDLERALGDWAHVNDVPAMDTLFVAAALGPHGPWVDRLRGLPAGRALVAQGRLVGIRVGPGEASRIGAALAESVGKGLMPVGEDDAAFFAAGLGLQVEEIPGTVPQTLVDLMAINADTITSDFDAYEALLPPPDPNRFPGVHFLDPERIRLAEGIRLDPGVVLDAREGPILLGPDTQVHAASVIVGPVVTGAAVLVKPISRVADGVSLGPVTRVGGELHATIVQGFSNKQHDGFLGHSYVGCWVNLGAATDTSDLKNDYGTVRIVLAGREVDTGRTGVGSLLGDHVKTAIHTRLNTGTVVGPSSNVFGDGIPSRAIAPFSWGGGNDWVEYRADKAMQVAARVMERRHRTLDPAEEALLRRIAAEARP